MKAMVLGVGLQGRAVIHDLSNSEIIDEVIAVDIDLNNASKFIEQGRYENVRFLQIDAEDKSVLVDLITKTKSDVVICMMPTHLNHCVAECCIDSVIPFVSTIYSRSLEDLDERAKSEGVLLLPEMGFDPGIDLILGAKVIEELDEIHGLNSYGSGVPAPEACDNPINYKISWTFDGVLAAYTRPACLMKNNREIRISGQRIFDEEHVHTIQIPGLGQMEAYPNGDALQFIEMYGLGPKLKEIGRYTARWPGHCAFWRTMSVLGFLETLPIDLGRGISIAPRTFLSHHLAPRLQYRENEQDLAFLRVHAWGIKNGLPKSVIYELVDYRDIETGFFAMNRTVGYTASIAAQMILKDEIRGVGILSPVRDVDPDKLLHELTLREVNITRRFDVGDL